MIQVANPTITRRWLNGTRPRSPVGECHSRPSPCQPHPCVVFDSASVHRHCPSCPPELHERLSTTTTLPNRQGLLRCCRNERMPRGHCHEGWQGCAVWCAHPVAASTLASCSGASSGGGRIMTGLEPDWKPTLRSLCSGRIGDRPPHTHTCCARAIPHPPHTARPRSHRGRTREERTETHHLSTVHTV